MATAVLAQAPPASTAEAEAAKLLSAGQTAWRKKQFPDAVMQFARLQDEFAATSAAPQAGLGMGHVLVALGDPIAALEEFQQVRTRWPKNPAAASALAYGSVLRRLYARPADAPAYGPSEKAGAEKLDNLLGLAVTSRGAVYRSAEKSVEALQPADGDLPPSGPFSKPRLTLDNAGNLVVLDAARMILPAPARPLSLRLLRPNKPPQPLDKIESAVQLSTGDWLVMDADEKQICRFTSEGSDGKLFETSPKGSGVRALQLAVNAFDEVAAIDADAARIVLFDATGAIRGTIPFKRRATDVKDPLDLPYELKEPRDVAFDAFGHLYVLDQKQIAIFNPYAGPPRTGAARPGTPEDNWGDDYHLRTLFSEAAGKGRDGFKASVFAIDRSGAVYLYDESLKQILVYR